MRLHLTAISLIFLSGSAFAQESYSAKSLFFGEDDSVVAVSTAQKNVARAPISNAQGNVKITNTSIALKKSTNVKNIGASYFIRLKNPDGTTKDVLASRKFKSGERFQLGVKVNRPSYVYIFNEDPNGRVTQIYPKSGYENFVNAMGVVFLPSQGAFEFDQEPGVEQLLVYVSKTPIAGSLPSKIKKIQPDFITAVSDTSQTVDSSCENLVAARSQGDANKAIVIADSRDYASKAITFSEDTSCNTKTPQGDAYVSKGITFSDDQDGEGIQPASYVVKKATTPDTTLFLKIKLHHQ